MVNILLSITTDCIHKFQLTKTLTLKVLIIYELHFCDVQVLAVHDVRFLSKTLQRLNPSLKRSNVERCFEMAYDVECESCFG